MAIATLSFTVFAGAVLTAVRTASEVAEVLEQRGYGLSEAERTNLQGAIDGWWFYVKATMADHAVDRLRKLPKAERVRARKSLWSIFVAHFKERVDRNDDAEFDLGDLEVA